MKLIKNTIYIVMSGFLLVAFYGCEQESFEPELTIEDGAGTLSNYMAYTLDSIVGVPDSTYGRVVFWEGLNGKTLVQLSMYNVPIDVNFSSMIASGPTSGTGAELIKLYDISNTGEGYTFGEFSTSKYFIISDTEFYGNLSKYDAHVMVENDGTPVAEGDIGSNADPVEQN